LDQSIPLINCFAGAYVIKIKCLSFVSINNDLDWNYFRIENDHLQPSVSGSAITSHPCYEHLVELSPSVYIDGKYWYEPKSFADGLPDTARPLSRILKGDLVIFKKTAAYNDLNGADDGKHAKMSLSKFKEFFTGMYYAFQ